MYNGNNFPTPEYAKASSLAFSPKKSGVRKRRFSLKDGDELLSRILAAVKREGVTWGLRPWLLPADSKC